MTIPMDPSPELDEYFELCKRIYLRMQAEGRWEEVFAKLQRNASPLKESEEESEE